VVRDRRQKMWTFLTGFCPASRPGDDIEERLGTDVGLPRPPWLCLPSRATPRASCPPSSGATPPPGLLSHPGL